ncbi:MAG: malto-oligosyltrehalose trehalohydrolase [Hydrogenophaga sp.]|uniref:malto-oligosyltrehalose trehalohydrolase n=1 Tax=Hydrogenophaga sp. TaxID=1904254 RepID=UPI002624D462|nr:malto-oligosyltrehalose trehalohydrolase [Hydrogenophaga sp.]MDM7941380.1 malto-oligosyltrehalose trehalohydrolase [Hydrogenophaga sp.]
MKRLHEMPFGAAPTDSGGARVRLWAPAATGVVLVRSGDGPDQGSFPMKALDDGWHELELPRAHARTDYAFCIDGGPVVPDPASRCQRSGVHGPSSFIDPWRFDWNDAAWRGRPWHEAVIYELHVGCLTTEGTFASAISRLDALVALGVTAIELMPVAEFEGRHGWGYDGVLPFAPKAAYGTPDDLKRLVCAAHQRGLMVFMDVVYNHFGPDGNYLHAYAPGFFNPDLATPWGAAINLDGPGSRWVRDFFIHNALYWIEEFHLDGLRIDAVHAMHDSSSPHFIDELVAAVRAGPGRDRQVHLVLENDLNDAARLRRDDTGAPLLADAQWNDDVHHAVHVLATGETDGYYVDYAAEPVRLFGRALAEGFGFQGDPSPYRGGERRGTPSAHLSPLAFVNSLQTHDQVGNRAFGERIATLAAAAERSEALRALLACVLLAPSPPMLFMGEEWAASTPFLYFCDYQGELARAVTQGRRAEFGRFARFSDPDARDAIPDPNAATTFAMSQLDWSEREQSPHAEWLVLTSELLRLRQAQLMPWLRDVRSGVMTQAAPGTLAICWPLGGARRWHLLAQLAPHESPAGVASEPPGAVVYRSHAAGARLAPWSVQFSIETP